MSKEIVYILAWTWMAACCMYTAKAYENRYDSSVTDVVHKKVYLNDETNIELESHAVETWNWLAVTSTVVEGRKTEKIHQIRLVLISRQQAIRLDVTWLAWKPGKISDKCYTVDGIICRTEASCRGTQQTRTYVSRDNCLQTNEHLIDSLCASSTSTLYPAGTLLFPSVYLTPAVCSVLFCF